MTSNQAKIVTKTALELPEAERGIPQDQVERWDRAKVRLVSPLAKQEARDSAIRSMDQIETHPKRERERKWRETAIQETIDLAKGRGDHIDPGAVSKDGERRKPIRRLTTGGLHEAFRRGTLGEATPQAWQLLKMGDLYRDCYERDTAMTTPERTESVSSGGPKMAQSAVLHAGQVLAILRAGLSKLELDVLDQVCGQDVALNIARAALRKRDTSVSGALRSGLERAAENWSGKGEDDVRPKQEWDRMSDAIARAQRRHR